MDGIELGREAFGVELAGLAVGFVQNVLVVEAEGGSVASCGKGFQILL